MNLSLIIKNLIEIDKYIYNYYYIISELETNLVDDSNEYSLYFQEILNLIEKEKNYLNLIASFDYASISKELAKYRNCQDKVDYIKDAPYYRLKNMIDGILGDDLMNYALILQNDINLIALKIVNNLCLDAKYFNLRKYLLTYKYKMIYLNFNTENDFLTDGIEASKLEANNYRTCDLPSYIYVDKSILVLESKNFITDILLNSDNYQEDEEHEAYMIIDIINVLARLTLCNEETLSLVYDELMGILQDESINRDLQELIKEMLQTLNTIKSSISWAR